MMGLTKDMQAQPLPQAPAMRISRLALRAFRRHIEITEASSEKNRDQDGKRPQEVNKPDEN